jgi:hypothetical protein
LEIALEKFTKPNQELPKDEQQPRPYIPVNLAWVDQGIEDPEERIRPAQLAYLSPEISDTLILSEKTL